MMWYVLIIYCLALLHTCLTDNPPSRSFGEYIAEHEATPPLCTDALRNDSCNLAIQQLVVDIENTYSMTRNLSAQQQHEVQQLYHSMCRLFERVGQCVTIKISLCPHPSIRHDHPDVHWYMDNPNLSLIMRNCDQKDMVQAHRVDALCIYSNLESIQMCMTPTYQEMYFSLWLPQDSIPTPVIVSYCRIFKTFLSCVNIGVNSTCGAPAANFLLGQLCSTYPAFFVQVCLGQDNADEEDPIILGVLHEISIGMNSEAGNESESTRNESDARNDARPPGPDHLLIGLALFFFGLSTIAYAIAFL